MFVSNSQGLCSETAYGGSLTVSAGAMAELPWDEESSEWTAESGERPAMMGTDGCYEDGIAHAETPPATVGG